MDIPEPLRLNVGCGDDRIAGWVGIDKRMTEACDIVCDIGRERLPFTDGEVDEILADNVLEHIGPPEEFIHALNEFYRVLCKPGGRLTIIVPDGRSEAAWQDPTHVRAFVPRSALYWNQDSRWAKGYGITADFDVVHRCYREWSEDYIRFTCVARKIPR